MCFGPSTLGAGAKTRLESRIKKFTPHCTLQADGKDSKAQHAAWSDLEVDARGRNVAHPKA